MLGRKIFVLNDHKPLPGYVKGKDPHGRLARWESELQVFDLKIEHIKGVHNTVADGLSRKGEVEQIIAAVIAEKDGNCILEKKIIKKLN